MNRTNESLPRTPTLAAGPGGVHVRLTYLPSLSDLTLLVNGATTSD